MTQNKLREQDVGIIERQGSILEQFGVIGLCVTSAITWQVLLTAMYEIRLFILPAYITSTDILKLYYS